MWVQSATPADRTALFFEEDDGERKPPNVAKMQQWLDAMMAERVARYASLRYVRAPAVLARR